MRWGSAALLLAACATPGWIGLTDAWEPTRFGGEGEVRIAGDAIALGSGSPLTGVTWRGNLPPEAYELSCEARRLDGTDFFAAITFPVAGSHASLVLGGWGGSLVGISSLDGLDASENVTRSYRRFERGQWYRIGLQVTGERIVGTIDGETVVDVLLAGREVSVRPEVELSRPLGIASYQTRAEIRGMRWRPVR